MGLIQADADIVDIYTDCATVLDGSLGCNLTSYNIICIKHNRPL